MGRTPHRAERGGDGLRSRVRVGDVRKMTTLTKRAHLLVTQGVREGRSAAGPRLLQLSRLRKRGGNGPGESGKTEQAFRPKPREGEAGLRGVGRGVRGGKQAGTVARERGRRVFIFLFFLLFQNHFESFSKAL